MVLLDRARSFGSAPAGPGEEITGPVRFTRENGLLRQEFEYAGRQIRLPLLGAMQRKNFRLVYRVLEFLAGRYGLDLDRALDGLANVRWPARCQQLNERLFVDGGHNPDGLSALRQAMEELAPGEKFTVIFAGFRDKDVETSLKLIAPLAAEFLFVPLHEADRPCRTPEELCAMARKLGVPAEERANALLAVNDALADTSRKVLVAGSLYLAGEVLADLADRRSVLDLA